MSLFFGIHVLLLHPLYFSQTGSKHCLIFFLRDRERQRALQPDFSRKSPPLLNRKRKIKERKSSFASAHDNGNNSQQRFSTSPSREGAKGSGKLTCSIGPCQHQAAEPTAAHCCHAHAHLQISLCCANEPSHFITVLSIP